MNTAASPKHLRFWAPIGLGASVAAALTAVLVGTVVSGQEAAPAREKAPIAPVSTEGDGAPACFRWNHRWPADVGRPQCGTAHR